MLKKRRGKGANITLNERKTSFFKFSGISDKLNIQNILLKGGKKLSVKTHLPQKTATYLRLDEIKGISPLKKIPDSIYFDCTVKIMH